MAALGPRHIVIDLRSRVAGGLETIGAEAFADPAKTATTKSLRDVRYTEALVYCWLASGDARYLAKAQEYLLAWAGIVPTFLTLRQFTAWRAMRLTKPLSTIVRNARIGSSSQRRRTS